MNARIVRGLVLALGLGVLIGLGYLNRAEPVSTYSTYDNRRNGYQALYDVLRDEDVPVQRLEEPLALRDSRVRVIVATSTAPELGTGEGLMYDSNDYARLKSFQKRGGILVYFAVPKNDPMLDEFKKHHIKLDAVLPAQRFTNLSLSKDPAAIVLAYNTLGGKGIVAFDERLHGYAVDRTMWSVMPWPVRAAMWLVVVAVLLVLVEGNVRFAPPIAVEPAADRDSSAYIASMAALLRRARARRSAIARFAKAATRNVELQHLAAIASPNDATVLYAASLASSHRKENA